MLTNNDLFWDEFRDWCEDNGVSLDSDSDWRPWFECWCAALEASGVEGAVEESKAD